MAASTSVAATRSLTPGGARRTRNWREIRAAYGFISLWIVGFLIFTLGPMIASLVLSFTDYNAIDSPQNVGLENYRQLVEDPKVAKALGNTLVYAAMFVPASMAVALALALVLNRVGRASGFFRTVFYLPKMTPTVAVGALFLLLLNGQEGLLNRTLRVFGIDGPNWTTDTHWVKPGLVITTLWSLGGTVVIYLAALRQVPKDLYEAAELDGAGRWTKFRKVTIPMISGALFFTLIVQTIAALQMFNEAYTMFFGAQQNSTYSNEAALFYVIYLFQQAFRFLHMGYASALAWLLFLIIMIITAVQVRVSRRFVYYEGERD
ncbi:sugar ABC transporter permease [Micromonospora soli]|uniref:carbohydrate ABC transporter permease n=1 Tax=Micromonospora sp. NBRC 110009 TaxID=3061627 RepID=UPI0026731AB8|nr:sugar ABC transporter permease [Micromonospora sp. NBRC 110009]WKT99186.1 sugar ABC transporter permease [Micromonospora sp. NBRC 110009]